MEGKPGLHRPCFSHFCHWSKKFSPKTQSFRRKTKANHDLITPVFRASENFLVVTLSSHWLSGMPPHWSNVTSRAVTWCCLLHITEGFWPRSLSVITTSDLFPGTEKVISSGSACYSVLKGSNFKIWDINISFFLSHFTCARENLLYDGRPNKENQRW